MSRKTDTCAALAVEVGVPFKEVTEQQRRLSENGFGPRFSKAKESQVFTDMHLASQTAATMIRSPSPFIFLEERGVAGYLSAMTLKALELRVQLSAEHLMIKSHTIKFLLWVSLLIVVVGCVAIQNPQTNINNLIATHYHKIVKRIVPNTSFVGQKGASL